MTRSEDDRRADDRDDERADDLVEREGVPPETTEGDPEAPLYSTVPLETEDGEPRVIQQQNVGPDNELGGGEWPDPETPPRSPAPGAR